METIIFLCNGEAEYDHPEKGVIKNMELPGLIKSELENDKLA